MIPAPAKAVKNLNIAALIKCDMTETELEKYALLKYPPTPGKHWVRILTTAKREAFMAGAKWQATKEWIPVTDRLPQCEEWDSHREAYFSTKVFTYSTSHGITTNYLRKDDISVDFMIVTKTRGLTHKWGVSGDDKTITHWMPLMQIPK